MTVLSEAAPAPPAGVTTLVDVPALRYTQLRLLAECAAALQGHATFAFTDAGELVMTGAPSDSDIAIPAWERGKYSPNVLRLRAPGRTPGPPGPELTLPDTRFADSVFWSDAAVQKFLVPYVASCAAHEAVDVLWWLRAAWNSSIPRVQVYALLHAVAYADAQDLSLWNALHVVYAVDSELHKLHRKPLGDFIREFKHKFSAERPVPPWEMPSVQRQGAVPYRRGTDHGRYQRPGYAALRAMAEAAASLRDGTGYFVFREGGSGFESSAAANRMPALGAGDFMVPACTPAVPADRPRLEGVWCHPGGEPGDNLADRGDALFWSNGAVEQFLYPYYASKGGIRKGVTEQVLLSMVWGDLIPWQEAPSDHLGATAERMDEPRETSVAALVHMHTSEWIPEVSSVAQEIALVSAEGAAARLAPSGDVITRGF